MKLLKRKEKVMSTITIVLLLIYVVGFGGGSIFLICKSMGSGNASTTIEGKDGFGSRMGFILSTIGMSVGVGAMWRFPMMCAQWGGGAFVLAFVIICVVCVLPAGWAELGYGRHFGKGAIDAGNEAVGLPGRILGWIMSLDQICLWAYYPAIMALVVAYIFKTFKGLDYASSGNAEQVFTTTNGNRPLMYGILVCLLLLVAFIGAKGIANGIEKLCKVLLPALAIILIVLVVRVCMIPGIAAGIEFYIKPDWSMLANPKMWASAAGMALFAVGLGPGCLLTYSRYVDKKQDIAMDFITVNVVQLFICLLSGLVIVPAIVTFGMSDQMIEMGKGVMFVALPQVFATIAGGPFFMILFFIALLFAGISSSINQLEVGLTGLMDEHGLHFSRKKATIVGFVIAALIAIPCTWNDAFFKVFDNVIGNIGYCVCALFLACICAWAIGAKKVREEWYGNTTTLAFIKHGRWIDILYKYLFVLVMAYFTITAIISLFQ